MKKLLETLTRLGAVELAGFLGHSIVALLELLDLKHLQATRLAELVLTQYGPEDLLLDSSYRQKLTDALSQDDAERLCRLIKITPSPDAWVVLRQHSFPKGSSTAEILFGFFGYSPPMEEIHGPVSRSDVEIAPEYNLFTHQVKACRECLSYLSQGNRPRVLLHMPTGSGKTRTAMNVLSHFLRYRLDDTSLIVWLAHSEELCEQASEEFEKAWRYLGNRAIHLYRAYGAHRSDLQSLKGGLLVAGLQLLYRRSLSEQDAFFRLSQRVSLVVIDEAHQAIAPTYKHLLDLLTVDPRTSLLGLSATPGRSLLDAHQDMELAQFFHRHKVTLQVQGYTSPIEYLQDEGYLAHVDYHYIPYTPGRSIHMTREEIQSLQNELDLPQSVIKKLGQDHKRNFLILSRLIEEAKTGVKIIVFACSVEHAHVLASILAAKGFRAGAITNRTSPARRRQLIAEYKAPLGCQILCNYGVLTSGFDAPKTKCALIARPTQSVVLYSQMVGRAVRGPRAGGNERCKIISVVDQLPGFRSVAEAFEYFEEIWE